MKLNNGTWLERENVILQTYKWVYPPPLVGSQIPRILDHTPDAIGVGIPDAKPSLRFRSVGQQSKFVNLNFTNFTQLGMLNCTCNITVVRYDFVSESLYSFKYQEIILGKTAWPLLNIIFLQNCFCHLPLVFMYAIFVHLCSIKLC